MDKIGFVYQWGADPATSWSGTPMGIFKGLEAADAVVSHPIELSAMQNKWYWLYQRIFTKLRGGWDFNIRLCHLCENIVKKMRFSREEQALLMFAELYSSHIGKSYVYQDLSVNFLAEAYDRQQEWLKYTPLSLDVPRDIVKKRLKMVNRFYKDCAGLFTMSHWLCDYMKQSGVIAPEKVHYAGGGCNIDVTKIDGSQKQGNRFLLVGKDFNTKNGPLVVEAFRRLHRQYPQTELYIAGPKTREDCPKLGEGITFLGRLSYEELVTYYNLCDYFVMPSAFEAYGIVFAEALIFGLPCIGRNAFAMPEFIQHGENGYLIEREDPEELAAAMEAMLNNPQLSQRVAAQREQYIATYSWQAVADRIRGVISSQQSCPKEAELV